jgi:hypothetical protein
MRRAVSGSEPAIGGPAMIDEAPGPGSYPARDGAAGFPPGNLCTLPGAGTPARTLYHRPPPPVHRAAGLAQDPAG